MQRSEGSLQEFSPPLSSRDQTQVLRPGSATSGSSDEARLLGMMTLFFFPSFLIWFLKTGFSVWPCCTRPGSEDHSQLWCGSTVNTSTERRPRQVDFYKSEASQNYTMKPWAGSCSEDFAPRQCCALTRNRQETGMARRNPRGESGAVLCPGSSSDESPISLSTPQFSTADLYAEGS